MQTACASASCFATPLTFSVELVSCPNYIIYLAVLSSCDSIIVRSTRLVIRVIIRYTCSNILEIDSCLH